MVYTTGKIKVKICGKDPLTRRAVEAVMAEAGYSVVQNINDAYLTVADMPIALSELDGCDRRIYLCESGEALPRESGEILIKPVLFSDLTELADEICKRSLQSQADIISDGSGLVYKGERVSLSKRELALFCCLKEKEGIAVSREELLKNVWGRDSGTNITDVYVNYLRKKIKDAFGLAPIKAVRGKGYIYTSER